MVGVVIVSIRSNASSRRSCTVSESSSKVTWVARRCFGGREQFLDGIMLDEDAGSAAGENHDANVIVVFEFAGDKSSSAPVREVR